jgi:hypothetical protein
MGARARPGARVAKADRRLADPDAELREQLAGMMAELVAAADMERIAA